MASGMALRGRRVGSGPVREEERGEAAPRVQVSFWCASRHETRPTFSADAEIPNAWVCTQCGNPAGQDRENPPARLRAGPGKTHLEYLMERRTPADGEAILAEALRTSARRGSAPSGQPAGEWCPACHYRLTAPSHKRICLDK